MLLGDVNNVLRGEVNIDLPQENMVLLKQSSLYCFLLCCKNPKAEPFMEWVVKTVLPWQAWKIVSAIEEKDVALALIHDDLRDRDNQIQAILYENVALQAQRDGCQAQLQRCEITVTNLRTHYVDYARDPDKDNIIIIVRKHTTSANDKYHDLSYYVSRIQLHKTYVKLRWFDLHFNDNEVIVEIGNPNSVYAFNRFEEEGHVEQRYNCFRLIDLTRQELYVMEVPTILEEE